MPRMITELTGEQRNTLISEFTEKLGSRLRAKRNALNLTQTELGNCLGVDHSTISKYESGDRNMKVEVLPLYSAYCKFPLYELFPKDESQAILDTFSKAIIITVERKERQERLHLKKLTEK